MNQREREFVDFLRQEVRICVVWCHFGVSNYLMNGMIGKIRTVLSKIAITDYSIFIKSFRNQKVNDHWCVIFVSLINGTVAIQI